MALASCASYTSDAPLMGISNNSINTYVAADLDYDNAKKVSGEIESKTLFFFIPLQHNGNKQLKNANRYRGMSKAMRQALYNAKESSDVDIIMEPEFKTEKHSYLFGLYKRQKVTVEGWGVNMKGLKEDKNGLVNPTTTAWPSNSMNPFNR